MYNFKEIEPEMRKFWRKINALNLLEKRKLKQKYFLLDGPPYANFIPHVGHIRNTVYKDLLIRLKQMQGYDVLFQPGFDTHGLPIENTVEKKLKITSKKDIEKQGIHNFTKACKEHAATNKDIWIDVYDTLGSWYSWKDPYLTYQNDYVESGWWTFKKFYEKGLVYEGKRPVFWCPHCETALAGYEVTDSYKMVTDPLIYVKFKLKDDDAYLLVFTTTPWTLPANVAVCAHPDETYVKVETTKGNLILAKERLQLLTDLEMSYKVIDEFKGKDLDGKEYENILDVPVQKELNTNPSAHKVYMSIPILKERISSKVATKKNVKAGDVFEHFVTVSEGTGLVHCAPGHGKTDNEVGKHYNLSEVSPLDDECKFTDDVGEFQGQFVKDADKGIIQKLEATDNLLHHDKISHSYPLCWRCKSKLIFRLSNQWFLKIEPVRDKMLDANESVNWLPDFAKERFENWVSNADDWNISRQRYWGIPIPVWRSDDGELLIIGSLDELKKYAKIKDTFDLHNASEITLKKDNKKFTRINDIFDVWYDSGIAPWAAFGYPKHNKKLFDTYYPVSRINESQDQIRGWFYSLMFCGVAAHDKAPYEAVSMPGWVVDEKGDKMSKSVGNVTLAKDGLAELGADVIRFYYFWDVAPYQLQKFNKKVAQKEVGKMFTILWNLQKILPQTIEKKVNVEKIEDKWLVSKLNSVIGYFTEQTEKFEFHEAARSVYNFIIEDVSRTYVQLVRSRLDANDIVASSLLYQTLMTTIKLLCPITPHISEKMYQNFKTYEDLKETILLEDYPQADRKAIDKELEKQFLIASDIIQSILSIRDKIKQGVRWPLKEALVESMGNDVKLTLGTLSDVIKLQTNVKKITQIDKLEHVKITVKPNYKQLGKDFGDKVPQIVTHIIQENAHSIVRHMDEGGYTFKINGQDVTITKDHVELEKSLPEHFADAEFSEGSIYVDKTRTKELDSEGYARELTRRIQQLRKESGLEKDDIINLGLKISDEMNDMLKAFVEEIKQKCGVKDITDKKLKHHVKEKIKGFEFEISLDKL